VEVISATVHASRLGSGQISNGENRTALMAGQLLPGLGHPDALTRCRSTRLMDDTIYEPFDMRPLPSAADRSNAAVIEQAGRASVPAGETANDRRGAFEPPLSCATPQMKFHI
jgi:hypothetical protein